MTEAVGVPRGTPAKNQGSSSSNSLGTGIVQGQARMYPRGCGSGSGLVQETRISHSPRMAGQGPGDGTGLGRTMAVLSFLWQHWCQDSSEVLAHGWAEERPQGRLDRDKEVPC